MEQKGVFFVYVLYSETFNKIYIGYTSSLKQRLLSHNKLATKGWTIKYRPWVIIHSEEFLDKKSAMKREKLLKGYQGQKWIRETLLKQNSNL